jgi:hypothetical protein
MLKKDTIFIWLPCGRGGSVLGMGVSARLVT